jgi:hypothetical protein
MVRGPWYNICGQPYWQVFLSTALVLLAGVTRWQLGGGGAHR